MTDLTKFQNARLRRGREECRANAGQLSRLANNVGAIMEAASIPPTRIPAARHRLQSPDFVCRGHG